MTVVLGGGISGLAASFYLLQRGHTNVKLMEAAPRLGGWIQTTILRDGVIFEHGPRTVRPHGVQGINTLELIDELGLSDKVRPILKSHPAALNRMIYVNKQLYPLPSSFLSMFKSSPPFTKPLVNTLFHDMKTPRKRLTDESIYHFVERRLGKEIAEFAVSPMICGICAGDAKEISVKFLMKALFEAEQNHGTIVRGMLQNFLNNIWTRSSASMGALAQRSLKEKWSVWSLKGGLEQLCQTLHQRIEAGGCGVFVDNPCTEIFFNDYNKAVIKTDLKQFVTNHVYCSIPAKQMSKLIAKQHPELSSDLAKIPTVSVAVVNLQYPGNIIENDAFGFLVPPSENLPILGVIYDSCCFPNANETSVVTVMMGGRWFEKLFGSNPSDALLLHTAIDQVSNILGLKIKPIAFNINISKDCIPQYVIGHYERVERIQRYIKDHKLPISLIGASYNGVGVNDVILSAKKAVYENQVSLKPDF